MKNEFSLDTALATDLVMPLLAYAELLKQGGAYAQSRLLLTIVEDLDRKLPGWCHDDRYRAFARLQRRLVEDVSEHW